MQVEEKLRNPYIGALYWYIMSRIQDTRNAFRFRRVARRTITKNKIDSGVLDQLKAIKLGLTE